VLLGYRFKRGLSSEDQAQGGHKFFFMHNVSRGYEHQPENVVLTAVPVSEHVYVVEGDTAAIFGKELVESFDKVVGSSSFFAAHREHQLLCFPGAATCPLTTLHALGRGRMALKPAETVLKLLVSVQAQLLYAVAQMFEKKFEGLGKASPAMIQETQRNFATACTQEVANLRKHVFWLMRDTEQNKLRKLMEDLGQKTAELKGAAFQSVTVPARVQSQLQDEIPGAEQRSKAAGNKGGDNSGGAGDKGSDKKGGDSKASGSKRSLEQMMGSKLPGMTAPPKGLLTTPNTNDFAVQLAAQLRKCPSEEEARAVDAQKAQLEDEVKTLKAQLRDAAADVAKETLRADREKQRFETERATVDQLRGQLTTLQQQIGQAANAEAAGSSGDTAQVIQLKSEISFLRSQVSALMLMIGGEKTTAANLLEQARKPT
jgi:hypothetical protein